jgi:predicted dehydrogenase
LAVIGVGHLGKEHARILSQLPQADLVGVADVNPEQARAVAARCQTRAFSDHRPLVGGVDAAVIAVPTCHHYDVAGEFLRHGVSLLVEKPLAAAPAQAQELVELARKHRAVLQVGHVERYNPAFEALQRLSLRPRFVTCQRLGPYTGRSTDIGAVLDLMIHDLDLLLAWLGPVAGVQSVGVAVVGGREDVANAHLVFANGCTANLTASRVTPAPLRQMRVWCGEGQAVLDFAQRQLTLLRAAGPGQPCGERAPQVVETPQYVEDQLTRELREFVECVRTGARPRVTGDEGRDAVALAARILEGMTLHAEAAAPATLPLPRADKPLAA